jgi:hypothetical protein
LKEEEVEVKRERKERGWTCSRPIDEKLSPKETYQGGIMTGERRKYIRDYQGTAAVCVEEPLRALPSP